MVIVVFTPDAWAWQQAQLREGGMWQSELGPHPYETSGMRRLNSDFNPGQLRKLATPDLELFRYLTDPSKW